jgi:hypothetical protein
MSYEPGPTPQYQQLPVVPGYPPQPGWAPEPPPQPQPQPPKNRTRLAAVLFSGSALLLLAVVAVVIVGRNGTGGGLLPFKAALTEPGAQRACRTAVGREWDARSDRAGGEDTTIITTVTSIEMLETWKAGDGYSVNATVHYTMTTDLVAPVQGSLDLTCTATGTDAAPVTTVANRN